MNMGQHMFPAAKSHSLEPVAASKRENAPGVPIGSPMQTVTYLPAESMLVLLGLRSRAAFQARFKLAPS